MITEMGLMLVCAPVITSHFGMVEMEHVLIVTMKETGTSLRFNDGIQSLTRKNGPGSWAS